MMTVLEALKSRVKYPLSEDLFRSVMIERNLKVDDEYTLEVSQSNACKGARADLLIAQVDCPQIQEGGMSISLTDKSNFIDIANTIYAEIGEPTYGQKTQPKITALYD